MSLFLSAKAATTPRKLTRNRLSAVMSSLLVIAAVGCSDKSADATTNSTSSIGGAQSIKADSVAKVSDPAVVKSLQANLQASGIEETILSATPTDMEGIYWVTGEGLPPFFADKAGRHIIQGQIIAVGETTPIDISAAFMADSAQQALKTVDKKDMIIYPAVGETKSVLYAFTDADCGYCRKMHEEMADINARGIEVRYLAWPRSQESVPKMEAIWCSEDRMAAMNQAKMGAEVQGPSCANPVQQQVELGAALGVRGTPAVFTQAGEQVGGYLPAAQLAAAVGIN
ncbi:MAG: DsbC family protein [Psychrobacter sp.]|nr:DsbC family protein [Psychrobacter sp.]